MPHDVDPHIAQYWAYFANLGGTVMNRLTPLSINGLNIQNIADKMNRDMIGYDRMFRMFQDNGTVQNAHAYPPYNIEMLNESNYRISIAVAGFGKKDIDITMEENILSIVGHQDAPEVEDDIQATLYRGIATRDFKRQFALADMVEVTSADMKDGMLIIELERIVPEEKLPKKIAIGVKKQK